MTKSDNYENIYQISGRTDHIEPGKLVVIRHENWSASLRRQNNVQSPHNDRRNKRMSKGV